MKEFKVALIGVGGRGQDLYRASMSKIENLCFVAVCDSSQENGEKTAKEMEENVLLFIRIIKNALMKQCPMW